MGEWWIYEDFPVSKVRVHRGACVFCKHGEGIHPDKVIGLNMKWWGPYTTKDEAWAVAQNLGRKDIDFCPFCCK